jgi:hypothetical protein
MKATCFLLLTMSSAPLMQWTNDAAISQQTSAKSSANSDSDHPHDAESAIPGDDAKRQKNGALLEGQRDPSPGSGKNHPRGPAAITKDHPEQPPKDPEHFPSGDAMDPRQPASAKSGGAAEDEFIHQARAASALTVRSPRVIRPAVPLLNNVRHIGPNPAVVGGSKGLDGRNAGAISGTHMNRKP